MSCKQCALLCHFGIQAKLARHHLGDICHLGRVHQHVLAKARAEVQAADHL
jgi:methyl coenzyme M reductase subunit C